MAAPGLTTSSLCQVHDVRRAPSPLCPPLLHTQALYQMLDPCFVGLILSVFNSEAGGSGQRVQVTAFQSVPAGVAPPPSPSAGELEGLDSDTASAIAAAVAAGAGWVRRRWCGGRQADMKACAGLLVQTARTGQQHHLQQHCAQRRTLEQAAHSGPLPQPGACHPRNQGALPA